MARSSLPKSSSKLNLSRRVTAFTDALEQVMWHGNEMAELLCPNHSLPSSKKRAEIKRKWDELRIKLAKTLL